MESKQIGKEKVLGAAFSKEGYAAVFLDMKGPIHIDFFERTD